MWFPRRKRNLIISGECHACGACCRNLILVDAGRSVDSREKYRRLVRRKPEFAVFRPHDQVGGSGPLHFRCERLGPDGRCTAYDERPLLCRRYPNGEMLDYGAELPEHCGYRIVPRRNFAAILEREQKRRERRGWRRFLPFSIDALRM